MSPTILGEWQGWEVPLTIHSDLELEFAKKPLNLRLKFLKDNKFEFHSDYNIMYHRKEDYSGTYTLTGNKLILDGKGTLFIDDFYSKGTKQVGMRLELLVSKDQLEAPNASKYDRLLFLRPGKMPAFPTPPPWSSRKVDARAFAVWKDTVRTYQSLRSYRDSGIMRSNGDDQRAKNLTFSTAYVKSGNFVFRAKEIGGPRQSYEMTFWRVDGKGYMKNGKTARESVQDVVESISSYSGWIGTPGTVVPPMLLNGRDKETMTSNPDILWLGEKEFRGRVCNVVCFRGRAQGLKVNESDGSFYYLDKATHLVLKIETRWFKWTETIEYKPQVDQPVPKSTFNLAD